VIRSKRSIACKTVRQDYYIPPCYLSVSFIRFDELAEFTVVKGICSSGDADGSGDKERNTGVVAENPGPDIDEHRPSAPKTSAIVPRLFGGLCLVALQ